MQFLLKFFDFGFHPRQCILPLYIYTHTSTPVRYPVSGARRTGEGGEGCVAKQFFTREKAENLSKGGTKHCTGFCCFNYFALFSLYPVSQSKLGSTTTPACLAHHPWPVRKGCAWRISKAIAICSLVHYILSSFASCSFLAKRCYGMKSLACALGFSCTSHKLPESCCQYIYMRLAFSSLTFVHFFFLGPPTFPQSPVAEFSAVLFLFWF